MVETIVCIAVGYAVGCLIAVAIMTAAMFSTKGIKWMYRKSKTVIETMMEEEAKNNEAEWEELDAILKPAVKWDSED